MINSEEAERNKFFVKNNISAVRKEFDRLKKETPYQHYRITDYFAEGGYAVVYLVESRFSAKKLAIRVCVNVEGRSDRELNAVRQLMLQGVEHIVDYLMMFDVQIGTNVIRCTLMNYLTPLSRCPFDYDNTKIAVKCGLDFLPLLQVCMQDRILHRDIKPDNIFYAGDIFSRSGLMLGDFGEARNDTSGYVTGNGTFATISPEVSGMFEDMTGDHHLCDMYSLGIVMYYYLNNRVYPFCEEKYRDEKVDPYLRRLRHKGSLPEPQNGSPRLRQLVLKATQHYPKDRFQSPQLMLNELRKCEEYRLYQSENNADEPVRVTPVTIRKKLRTGDTIPFGRFPQTSNGIVKPLIWRVLDVRDGKALLISEKLILRKAYHETNKIVTWEECTLHHWLNDDFLLKAFGTLRPEKVMLITNSNPGNANYHTDGGSDTRDRVFVLSKDEAYRYFKTDQDRTAEVTDYYQKLYGKAVSGGQWWLRTPGDYGNYAAFVNGSGCVRELGQIVADKEIAVRPALWLRL